jgi:hypothetical protein
MAKDVLKASGRELYLIFQRRIILLNQEVLSLVHFSKALNLMSFFSIRWQAEKDFQTQQ